MPVGYPVDAPVLPGVYPLYGFFTAPDVLTPMEAVDGGATPGAALAVENSGETAAGGMISLEDGIPTGDSKPLISDLGGVIAAIAGASPGNEYPWLPAELVTSGGVV